MAEGGSHRVLVHSAEQIVQVVRNGERVVTGKALSDLAVLDKGEDSGGLSIVVSSDGLISDIGTDEEILEKYKSVEFPEKVNATGKCVLPENLPVNKWRQRPNYFVAVQISNHRVQENVKRVQRFIVQQDRRLHECMNAIPTLHITLMVMNINNEDTREKALKALHNVYDECNEIMYKDPLQLEFSGLGNFNDRVLYAKIKRDSQYRRLCVLAECVKKHFAEANIFSLDSRPFNPHLTIAKIDFSLREQKGLAKIEPNLYTSLIKNHIGFQTIAGIQLLCMTGPKDDAGYYSGDSLIFRSPASSNEPRWKRRDGFPLALRK